LFKDLEEIVEESGDEDDDEDDLPIVRPQVGEPEPAVIQMRDDEDEG